MSTDTFGGVWNKVLLRCPSASSLLVQDWVIQAFRRLYRRRPWAWRRKHGQFIIPPQYTTGTVDVTQYSDTVTGNGTGWSNAHVGRQFRTATSTPIYTITAVDAGAQTLTLDQTWGPVGASGASYRIWQAYVTAPSDFLTFITLIDPNNNWRLHLHFSQEEINMWDAMRANSGNAYIVAALDYYNGLPRYELWPHVLIDKVYPYVYTALPKDLNESGATIPYPLNGDILVEMALAEAAKWPGPSEDKPNPYYDLNLVRIHEAKVEKLFADLEREDDEVYMINLSYYDQIPFAPLPFMDANFLQRHAL